jgi:antitoxin (DNA-binding transcriptional repressor) of toxin-antitoxin stability system
MYSVTADEAKSRLDELLTAALQGEAVFMSQDSDHIVQLVPITHTKRSRLAGSGKGTFTMSDDFDAPLADFAGYMP